MKLSVSILHTEKGYVPRLVFENPKVIFPFEVGDPCSTWKEAWVVARAMASTRNWIEKFPTNVTKYA